MRSSPGSAGPAPPSPASTRGCGPTCTCSARRSAAGSCRSPRSCRPSACWASSSPGSMARPSAEPAGLRGGPRGDRVAGHRRVPERSAKLGAHLHDRLFALPRDVVSRVRGRGLWAGSSSPRCRAASPASGSRRTASWPRTRTDRHPARPAPDDQRARPGLGLDQIEAAIRGTRPSGGQCGCIACPGAQSRRATDSWRTRPGQSP